MLALALVILSQAGTPKCITVDGSRVCGFDCRSAGGETRCAQTPSGVCEIGGGTTLLCFDPPVWLAQVLPSIPKPRCLWRGTRGACGYDCKAQDDQVACAQTPRGRCTTAYGKVVCADPPAVAYGVYGAEPPPPTCLEKEGLVACGYACASSGPEIGCAATPWGVCTVLGSTVKCFDPDDQVICAGGKATVKPVCKAFGDRVNCGYGCVDRGGVIACAKTPGGKCDASLAGEAACFDPPVTGGSKECLSVLGNR